MQSTKSIQNYLSSSMAIIRDPQEALRDIIESLLSPGLIDFIKQNNRLISLVSLSIAVVALGISIFFLNRTRQLLAGAEVQLQALEAQALAVQPIDVDIDQPFLLIGPMQQVVDQQLEENPFLEDIQEEMQEAAAPNRLGDSRVRGIGL